jgi:hypothetical protein
MWYRWREIMAVRFLEMGKDSVGKMILPSSEDDDNSLSSF